MAGQVVTLTLITTADRGIVAVCAKAVSGAASPASKGMTKISLRIADRIASTPGRGRDLVLPFNNYAMRWVPIILFAADWHGRDKAARLSKQALDVVPVENLRARSRLVAR